MQLIHTVLRGKLSFKRYYFMKTFTLLIAGLFFLNFSNSYAQNDKENAHSKALLAIRLMDDGKINESITILKECISLDPTNYDYHYEHAYAHFLKKDYKKVIRLGKKITKMKHVNFEIFALVGNAYDELDDPKKAIQSYDKGIKLFPDEGLLYLEKGIVYERRAEYGEAVALYTLGVTMDPLFPSNYYRLANLFLHSDNRVPGLIYGELFMNLERGSQRTIEMSKRLYQAYSESIQIESDTVRKIDFCKLSLSIDDLTSGRGFPLCMVFGLRFSLAAANMQEMSLQSLAKTRTAYIDLYFENDYDAYPIILFEFHQKMIENDVFDAYNHYIFQIGAEEEFKVWLEENEEAYEKFIDWFTSQENLLLPSKENYFIFTY